MTAYAPVGGRLVAVCTFETGRHEQEKVGPFAIGGQPALSIAYTCPITRLSVALFPQGHVTMISRR
jgi:hypothetical protein